MKRNLKKLLTIVFTLLMVMSLYGCGGKHASIADYIPDMENTASLCIKNLRLSTNCFVEVSEREKTEIIEYMTDLNLDDFEEIDSSELEGREVNLYLYVRLEYEGFEFVKAGKLYTVSFLENEKEQYISIYEMEELTQRRIVLKADNGTLDMEEIQSEIEKHIYENCDNPDYELDIKYDESIKTFADYLPEIKETEKVWLYNKLFFTSNFNHVESEAQEDILNTLLSLNLENFKPYKTPLPPWDKDSNSDQVLVRVVWKDASGKRINTIGIFNGEDGLYAYIKDERGLNIFAWKGEKDAFDYDALKKKVHGYL